MLEIIPGISLYWCHVSCRRPRTIEVQSGAQDTGQLQQFCKINKLKLSYWRCKSSIIIYSEPNSYKRDTNVSPQHKNDQ